MFFRPLETIIFEEDYDLFERSFKSRVLETDKGNGEFTNFPEILFCIAYKVIQFIKIQKTPILFCSTQLAEWANSVNDIRLFVEDRDLT